MCLVGLGSDRLLLVVFYRVDSDLANYFSPLFILSFIEVSPLRGCKFDHICPSVVV